MVLANYRRGLFPMGSPDHSLITWRRPSRRAIIPLDRFHVSRSLLRTLRLGRFRVTFDQDFASVIQACADRPGEGTWITAPILSVYRRLHDSGDAHSVEVWTPSGLAGGVYGVAIGCAFFAESKFHRERDMSKVALAQLVFRLRERGFSLLEVQYLTPHLARFGAIEIPDAAYMKLLREAVQGECRF